MSEVVSLDPGRSVRLNFRIKRRADKTFVFTENDIDLDISGYTWQLFIKKNAGDKKNVISLTLGFGLSIPIYSTNTLVASFTSVQTDIPEGEYYWELVRTDIEKTWLNGYAYFKFGPVDNAAD
jgi:hypothetical protein